jgi:hypothetical protein
VVWLVIVKGGINTRASARYEFGLGALSPPMQLVKAVHRLLVESLRLGRVAEEE